RIDCFDGAGGIVEHDFPDVRHQKTYPAPRAAAPGASNRLPDTWQRYSTGSPGRHLEELRQRDGTESARGRRRAGDVA
ncbi:hypothetical protein NDN91_18935, partial [Burkholderia glumae]|uniref:hypothetical protein n=1 Tax=Burkholderia glumae TaxID=337 RepID=UPI0020374ABB